MDLNYIVKLHKNLHINKLTHEEIHEKIYEHISHIPNGKLYRYRKCSKNELKTLEHNSIWLADPRSFTDIFDSKIFIGDIETVITNLTKRLVANLFYKAIEEEQGISAGKIDSRESLYNLIEEYEGRLGEEFTIEGLNDEFSHELKGTLDETITSLENSVANQVGEAWDFLERLEDSARKNHAIASFTVRHDNRNMWENYADGYQGMCLEYDFYKVIDDSKYSTIDIMNFMPVRYIENKEIFDNTCLMDIISDKLFDDDKLDSDMERFMREYYKLLLYKKADYRMEEEWRLIMQNRTAGEYYLPYLSKIILGASISKRFERKVIKLAKKLNVPIVQQMVSEDGTDFEYIDIL